MSCRSLVEGLNSWYIADAPENAVILNVVVEDNQSDPASAEVAAEWRDVLGLTFPVLADPDAYWQATWSGNPGRANHSYTVLDAEGRITYRQADGSAGSVEVLTGELSSAAAASAR